MPRGLGYHHLSYNKWNSDIKDKIFLDKKRKKSGITPNIGSLHEIDKKYISDDKNDVAIHSTKFGRVVVLK